MTWQPPITASFKFNISMENGEKFYENKEMECRFGLLLWNGFIPIKIRYGIRVGVGLNWFQWALTFWTQESAWDEETEFQGFFIKSTRILTTIRVYTLKWLTK